ncbi:hypothetical protein T06_15836, partial [Trichinella sp. T6]
MTVQTTEEPLHPVSERHGGNLTTWELHEAEEMWVRRTQEKEFQAEIQALVRHGRVAEHNRISQLDPYLDERGVLRAGGRLVNSDLPASMQHPAVLPGNHEPTRGLIRRCHQRQLHAGVEQTLACAVHLELVPQMTTARRAATEFCQLWQSIYMDRVQRELVGHRIHWKFIPDRALWMGGYWERLVRSVKESLRKVLGQALLDDCELQTILCEAEACLNARPLTFVNDGPGDPQPLSPFQLLTGRQYVDLPAVESQDPEWGPTDHVNPQWENRWRYRQQLMARWWRRLRSTYLASLLPRN